MKKAFSVAVEKKVQDFLRDEAGMSRRMVKDLKKNGGFFRNGAVVSHYDKLSPGDVLTVEFPAVHTLPAEPEATPLTVVYEDEDVLLIDKPVGMVTTPSCQHPHGTVVQAVLHHYTLQNWKQTVHLVNRLDRDTGGLLLIAKHPYSHSLFYKEEAGLRKGYTALVEGMMERKQGRITSPIARAQDSIIKREISAEGKSAVTRYEVLEEMGDKTLVSVGLETGRTHQIRVHMASIGHPLTGDTLYGGGPSAWSEGQALHASFLQFIHPWTKEKMSFRSAPSFYPKARKLSD